MSDIGLVIRDDSGLLGHRFMQIEFRVQVLPRRECILIVLIIVTVQLAAICVRGLGPSWNAKLRCPEMPQAIHL